MRKYQVLFENYRFVAEDDWGCYYKGEKILPKFKKIGGYAYNRYDCDDMKTHTMNEHTVKWEYFNGRIPEGLEIDHIIPIKNGGTNKLSNLRLVTHPENMNNLKTLENLSKATSGSKHPMYGKHHTDEAKQKISNKKKGIKHPQGWFDKMINNPSMSKEIIGFNEDGVEICRFPSVEEAMRNGYSKHICEVANGKRIKSNKLYWKWAN